MAQEIRVIGTVSCAAKGADHLSKCECARGLARSVSASLAENEIKPYLDTVVRNLRALEQGPAIIPPAPGTPSITDLGNIGGLSAVD
jgi:hypothetical protein